MNKVNESMDMFLEMKSLGPEPNVITYTTLITGLAKNGSSNEAIAQFKEMLEAGIQPNIVTITGLLIVCTTTCSLLQGRAIHGYIVRHIICLSIMLATSLVDMYAKCGNLHLMKKVFDIVSTKELPLYNALISSYALHGCAPEALSLFKHLQKEGIEPDSITFTGVLSLCSHAGLVIEGLEIFVDMVSNHQSKLSMEHYGCVVCLISRCGNLQEALLLFITMPFEADSHILGSLLIACREHNEVELGEYLAENLTKLEPGDSGNYVALSIALDARKWHEEEPRLQLDSN